MRSSRKWQLFFASQSQIWSALIRWGCLPILPKFRPFASFFVYTHISLALKEHFIDDWFIQYFTLLYFLTQASKREKKYDGAHPPHSKVLESIQWKLAMSRYLAPTSNWFGSGRLNYLLGLAHNLAKAWACLWAQLLVNSTWGLRLFVDAPPSGLRQLHLISWQPRLWLVKSNFTGGAEVARRAAIITLLETHSRLRPPFR